MSRRLSPSRALTLALALAFALPATAGAASAPPSSSPSGPGCDRLDDAACLLPFPNDAFTKADKTSATGRVVALRPSQMPRNAKGKAIDAAGWTGLDGFSPGSVILTKVPGLQTGAALKRTTAVSLSDLSTYTAKHAPVLVLDATTGKRWPIWAELDSLAPVGQRLLEIHPAKSSWRVTGTSSCCAGCGVPTAGRSGRGGASPSCATGAARPAHGTTGSSRPSRRLESGATRRCS